MMSLQIVYLFLVIWMVFNSVKLMLAVIDLILNLRILYLLCSFGLYQISDMMPLAAKGLQSFPYAFGSDITGSTFAFGYFDYTQLIFSSCIIQLIVLLICLICRYMSS